MKKQAGFTLIELIMVIVILGILSAFALPRFADFSENAEQAAVEGARGSVASASAIVHAAALVAGVSNDATGTVAIEGGNAEVVFGYPVVEEATAANFNIAEVAQLDGFNFDQDNTATPDISIISTSGAQGDYCFTYTNAADATTPAIVSSLAVIAADGDCDDPLP